MYSSHIDCKEEKLWIINCYVEGGSISCLPYHLKMTYCLKLFEKYFWQNICTVNLQYKLTIAKQALSQLPETQNNNFPQLPKMAMHSRQENDIIFQLTLCELCVFTVCFITFSSCSILLQVFQIFNIYKDL